MISSNKQVGIIVPVYNEINYIEESLTSIISQTYQNIKILVLDNCSNDGTSEFIKNNFQKKVFHKINKENLGPEKNFDLCIDNAFGDYTCIYHADDIYDRTIIAKQVDYLNNNSDVAAVFTKAKFIDEHGNLKYFQKLSLPNLHHKFDLNGFVKVLFKKSNFLICPSLMIRTHILREMGYWDWKYRSSADLEMWIRLLKNYNIGVINENLISYRISKKQWSQKMRARTSRADFFIVIKYFLNKYKLSKESFNDYLLLLIKDYFFRLRNVKNIRKKNKIIKLSFSIILRYKANIFYKASLVFLFLITYVGII